MKTIEEHFILGEATPLPVDKNVIPDITHPYGKNWSQPDTKQILIDDSNAVMSQATFDALAEYSCSIPTGVYEGKMWKCRVPYISKIPGAKPRWFLCWFGYSQDPNCVSNNSREIIIV